LQYLLVHLLKRSHSSRAGWLFGTGSARCAYGAGEEQNLGFWKRLKNERVGKSGTATDHAEQLVLFPLKRAVEWMRFWRSIFDPRETEPLQRFTCSYCTLSVCDVFPLWIDVAYVFLLLS